MSPIGTRSRADCVCPNGKGIISESLGLCVPCLPGQVNGGGTRCYACEPGQEPNAAKTACIPCGEGRFNDDEGGYCRMCPEFYQSNSDKTACMGPVCPEGFAVVSVRGQPLTCGPCTSDEFVSSSGTCQTCPSGQVPTS